MSVTYSTNVDVEGRLSVGELEALTKRKPYDATEVDRQRLRAYGLIRGKLGAKYSVPNAAALAGDDERLGLLREMELDLAEYFLWGNRREDIPKRTQRKYDATWGFLTEVMEGKAAMPGLDPLAETTLVSDQAKVVGPDRAFTRETMEGMF